MRKGRTLTLDRTDKQTGSSHAPIEKMIHFRSGNRNSQCSVLLFLILCGGCWMIKSGTEAAPLPALAGNRVSIPMKSNNGNSSSRPFNRCPAIFPVKASDRIPDKSPCRYFLSDRKGTLTTPGFPSAFPPPFECSWFINATGYEAGSFITLYLTQMYLTRGVKAVQYTFRNETHSLGRKELDELHTLRPRPYSVYRIKASYLEVQVNLNQLVNANLRVEHRLMDVYGFNITYEIQPSGSRIRSDTCNAVNCTFNGHCYANHDYSQFQCSCLPGFSGKYCQYGPECNPEKGINICKNGGTCGYRTGLTVVRCSCPLNYNGSLCEFRREFIPAKECLSRFRLNCSHQCVVTDKGSPVCRCPLDQALRSDTLTCYPLVPLRVLGQLEISKPNEVNDSRWVDGVTATMKKLVEQYTAGRLALSSLNQIAPNSNRLGFVLWNSESYNISWTAPTTGLKYRSNSTSTHEHIASYLNNKNKRLIRNVRETQLWLPDESWNVTSTPHQWNVAYSSFVKQIASESWKVLGETVQVRHFKTIQVPALLIDWVKLDVKGHVREGYPFTVACNANGSKKVKLEWFKDGHPVDAAFTLLRNMSVFVHQAQDLRGYFTLYLEVKQASVADRGEYQCRASDWGQSMRKSVFLDVITPPILDLMPINSAVYPGTAVNLTCRDENHLARRTITKYIWLKNGQPIESSCDEIIEDLTPVGSLLKITSIQNSTNYTCRGENGSSPANKTTHIFVVQPKQACPAEKNRGIEWPMTAADVTNYQFCPAGYIGVAKRHCRSIQELPDTDSTSDDRQTIWEETDFAHCTARNVSELYRQFKLITLGYLVTDFKSIVDKFTYLIHKKLEDIHGQSVYLPGEGNALLEMAKSLETFMLKKTDMLEKSFWHWTAVDYLYALDDLLSMPADFFRSDGGILVMRLIQNHVVLLDSNPSGVIDSTRLKNCDIDTQSPRKQLKYKRMLPILRSQSGFRILKQMAPAQLILNGTNVTMDFHLADQMTGGGDYLCALLHLQPATDYSRSWDMDSCRLERLSDSLTFRCHCFNQGTVAILYAERESMEVEDGMVDLWIIIYFETSTCHLLVIIGLIILSCRWYRKRTIWAWFQIQLAISLLPMSSTYFLQTKSLSSNSFWAILLTLTTYLYVMTVGAMMLIQLKNNSQRPGDTEVSGQRTNLRLIGLSLGIPLALSGVQMLLEEFTSRSITFTNWLFELDSVSGIFFCLAYCTMVFIILVLYVISLRQTYPIDKSNESRLINSSVQYNHCCLALAGLSLLLTGSMLSRFKWMSLSIHCFAAMFHLLAVMMWSSLMLASSGTGFICTFWMHRSKMSGAGETVSEMLNATAMVESPQRRGLLSEEQHPCINGGDVTRTRRISHDSADDIVNPASNRCKRQNRSGPASSPLLQRAGLGPDVLRAFGLEQSRPGKQSDRIIIMQGSSLSGMNEATDSIGRDRINSSTNSERMQRDDLDSGFGPSGGGGSQKFNRLDKFSDAWKFLSRMRWKLPQLVFSSNGSTSCGGSFRSRQSTMSSATTTEFGNERGSSVTTEETEIQLNAEDTESFMASYRLRRSRTRWTEDYGQENELDSREVANLTMVMCKPFRGRCFIRCSPEKIGSNTLWAHQSSGERLTRGCHPHNNCCERCWHNPETPFCDLCLISNPPTLNRSATISVQAVIENPPELPDVGEYLEMDSAGSIAVDEERAKRLKQEYYNVVEKGRSEPINRNNKDVVSCSSCSPTLSRPKKILSGRIVKKYRLSLRNVVHSTQQQWRQQGGKQNETGPAIAGHRTERL